MTDAPTYGSRFLDAWKRYAQTLSQYDYATIQAMKAADREAFIALLKDRCTTLPYATIQLFRECDPEEAARVMYTRAMQARQVGDASIWILLAIT